MTLGVDYSQSNAILSCTHRINNSIYLAKSKTHLICFINAILPVLSKIGVSGDNFDNGKRVFKSGFRQNFVIQYILVVTG
jgi:hypothetical protein